MVHKAYYHHHIQHSTLPYIANKRAEMEVKISCILQVYRIVVTVTFHYFWTLEPSIPIYISIEKRIYEWVYYRNICVHYVENETSRNEHRPVASSISFWELVPRFMFLYSSLQTEVTTIHVQKMERKCSANNIGETILLFINIHISLQIYANRQLINVFVSE